MYIFLCALPLLAALAVLACKAVPLCRALTALRRTLRGGGAAETILPRYIALRKRLERLFSLGVILPLTALLPTCMWLFCGADMALLWLAAFCFLLAGLCGGLYALFARAFALPDAQERWLSAMDARLGAVPVPSESPGGWLSVFIVIIALLFVTVGVGGVSLLLPLYRGQGAPARVIPLLAALTTGLYLAFFGLLGACMLCLLGHDPRFRALWDSFLYASLVLLLWFLRGGITFGRILLTLALIGCGYASHRYIRRSRQLAAWLGEAPEGRD